MARMEAKARNRVKLEVKERKKENSEAKNKQLKENDELVLKRFEAEFQEEFLEYVTNVILKKYKSIDRLNRSNRLDLAESFYEKFSIEKKKKKSASRKEVIHALAYIIDKRLPQIYIKVVYGYTCNFKDICPLDFEEHHQFRFMHKENEIFRNIDRDKTKDRCDLM